MHRTVLTSALAILTASLGQAQWSTAALSKARSSLESVTVGDLVLFAGGREGSTLYDDVDIYNAATDAWLTTTNLSMPQTNLTGAAVGTLALFAGGSTGFGVVTKVGEVFASQTLAWSTATLSVKRSAVAATTVGTKVLFAGGGANGNIYKLVDIYDASIGLPSNSAAWSTASLSVARGGICAVTVGDLAIFAGGAGVGGVEFADVDIYDASLGEPDDPATWSTASLSVSSRKYYRGGTSSSP